MFKKSIFEFILYSAICGLIYPLFIYTLGNLFFRAQANGSIIEKSGVLIGSSLIGQNFSDPKYFWGRPSSTSPVAYNGLASGASNLALSNPLFKSTLEARATSYHDKRVPVELITSSGSGLDPDISLGSAKFQAERVAAARGISIDKVNKLIDKMAQKKALGFMGTLRVNVLLLNIELDNI